MVDDKAPRNEWLMGRVEETYPGKDGTIRKPLTTAELLDEIQKLDEDDVSPSNIYILPPVSDGIETDEDSGEGDCNDRDRLSGHQLQAAAVQECDSKEPDGEVDKSTKRIRTTRKPKKVK
ncbi:hypothetical protein JTB14_015734 [Gonioctena quinquepunctata]|nr:hypothetical protein JTB14_015734 [Gonioctena quinquepunctata]